MKTNPAASSSLASQVRRGLWWGLLGGLGQQAASVLSTIVVARLLSPAEFGLVVAANVVVAMAGLFTYMGIQLAIVRSPELDDERLWTLFWMSTALGVAASATCVGLSALAADAMNQPDAQPYLMVLGALILVQTLSGVPRALLQREMRFGAIYAMEFAAALCQALSAITAAVAGLGAWSLVVGYAVHSVLLLGFWMVVRRRPRLTFSLRQAREQVRFGAGMWITTMLTYVVRNADFWAVSRVLGGSSLGVYYIAYVLPNVLRQRLTWVTGEVLLPSFARIQGDRERLAGVYLRSVRLHVAVGAPAMAGLAATSPLVILVFFGEKWEAAAAPMALVSLAAAAEFVTLPATNLLVALGRSRALVGIQLGRVAVLVPGVVLAARAGGLTEVSAVVLGSAVATALHAQFLCSRYTASSFFALVTAMAPALLATGVMALGVLACAQVVVDLAPIVRLLALGAVGVVLYPVALRAVAPRTARSLLGDLRLLVRVRKGHAVE